MKQQGVFTVIQLISIGLGIVNIIILLIIAMPEKTIAFLVNPYYRKQYIFFGVLLFIFGGGPLILGLLPSFIHMPQWSILIGIGIGCLLFLSFFVIIGYLGIKTLVDGNFYE